MGLYRYNSSDFYHWKLPDVLHADNIEAINIEVQKPNYKGLMLDISTFKRPGFAAEGRLLGLLINLKRLDKRIVVRVKELPEYLSESRIWKVFTTSAVGLILGRLCEEIVDANDIEVTIKVRAQQAELLKCSQGYLLRNQYQNGRLESVNFSAPIVDEFGRPTSSELCKERSSLAFSSLFRQCLSQYAQLSLSDELAFERVNDFVFEAFQNTWDHATTDLKGYPIFGQRFISIRSFNLDVVSIDSFIAEKTGRATHLALDPISSYFNSLQSSFSKSDANPTANRLIEITVADSGFGIAARMARVADVRDMSIDNERNLLFRALQPGGTSKQTSVVGAGLGLYKIMQAAHRLRGVVLFRTGRLNMFRHYLDDDFQWPGALPHNISDWEFLRLSEWEQTSSASLAGTCISLIFPWTEKANLAQRNLERMNAEDSQRNQLTLAL